MEANQKQAELWNEASGRTWVDMQPILDAMLAPFGDLVIDQAFSAPGQSVLDVGCGAGATTIAMARRLGPTGRCLGVDISAPLVAAAQRRAAAEAPNAGFLQADAQVHRFEPQALDAVMSRFGVMFFDDPVAAFSNIRGGVRPGGKLAFLAWRSPAENPFFSLAAQVAAPYVPPVERRPDDPGQFAFADDRRVLRILDDSGWRGAKVQAVDIATQMAEPDLLAYITRLGPIGLVFGSLPEETRAEVRETLRAAYAPYVQDGAARFSGACWLVTAQA